MDNKTFTLVGVSTKGKITKFRVANGDMAARINVLERDGHTDIDFIELPVALSKVEAIEAYKVDHPDTSEIRMPNEKAETAKTTKVKTVNISKAKVTDAATDLLNAVDAVDEVNEAVDSSVEA